MSWLATELGRSSVVKEAYLFGSFVTGDGRYLDVDCVIVFDSWDVRAKVQEVRRRFMKQFGKSLHVQMFHKDQEDLIRAFLRAADRWEKILG